MGCDDSYIEVENGSVGDVERIKDPPHFDKLFLALMLKRMESKRDTGELAENYPTKTHALDTLLKRLHLYISSANTAHLVDAANFLWIEFMYPSHDASYFRPITEPQPRVPVRENRIRCFYCIVAGAIHCPHEKG